MCWTSLIVDLSGAAPMTKNHDMIMLVVKNRLRSRTRVAILRFQSALSLKNRLRSRTRVTTLHDPTMCWTSVIVDLSNDNELRISMLVAKNVTRLS